MRFFETFLLVIFVPLVKIIVFVCTPVLELLPGHALMNKFDENHGSHYDDSLLLSYHHLHSCFAPISKIDDHIFFLWSKCKNYVIIHHICCASSHDLKPTVLQLHFKPSDYNHFTFIGCTNLIEKLLLRLRD